MFSFWHGLHIDFLLRSPDRMQAPVIPHPQNYAHHVMSQNMLYIIMTLQQKNCHGVCRTTCRQPCMKPSWQSQPSLWCCLGVTPCAVLWREHHKAAPRSDTADLRTLADMHASTHTIALSQQASSPTGHAGKKHLCPCQHASGSSSLRFMLCVR